jgi:dipeptidyl aminopeptidase/acylaminoacyl peptidase
MRKILEEISPANRVDRISRPLLVAQGANDPRVPLSESDQIFAALQNKGVPVWYVVAKDEGHGFSKKTNNDYLRAVSFEFVERCLLGSGDDLKTGTATAAKTAQ